MVSQVIVLVTIITQSTQSCLEMPRRVKVSPIQLWLLTMCVWIPVNTTLGLADTICCVLLNVDERKKEKYHTSILNMLSYTALVKWYNSNELFFSWNVWWWSLVCGEERVLWRGTPQSQPCSAPPAPPWSGWTPCWQAPAPLPAALLITGSQSLVLRNKLQKHQNHSNLFFSPNVSFVV